MSSPVWKFFSVAEEDNAIAICNVCSARILRGGKKASSFNTTNLISHLKGRHRGEAVLRDFKQPPLLATYNALSHYTCSHAVKNTSQSKEETDNTLTEQVTSGMKQGLRTLSF